MKAKKETKGGSGGDDSTKDGDGDTVDGEDNEEDDIEAAENQVGSLKKIFFEPPFAVMHTGYSLFPLYWGPPYDPFLGQNGQ